MTSGAVLSFDHSRTRAVAITADMLYGLTVLLAAILPFEIIRPVITLPWFVFTNLELVLLATALIWIAHIVLAGLAPLRSWRSTAAAYGDLLLPTSLFLLVALFSAIQAPAYRAEALKFVTRFASGVYALFLVVNTARTRRRLAGLLWAIILGAGLSALLGLLEAWNWRAFGLLSFFKFAPTLVGGVLRVSATFQYATIAAMFFEMAVPVAVGLAASAKSRGAKIVATSMACLCSVVVVLTLTRTGIVTLTFVLVIALILAWRWPRWRALAPPAVLVLLTLFVALCMLGLKSPVFRTRLSTEDDSNWYNAEYAAPATLNVRAGEYITTSIEVRNTGQVPWQSRGDHAYALGARWLTLQDRRELDVHRVETELPGDISPGQSITLRASARATLPPGTYRLSWGMLQRDILWFRHRNVPEAETVVQVLPGPEVFPAPPFVPAEDLSLVPPTLPRQLLWQAAWLMVRARPLLGVGPDNFRHLHGQYLGLTIWNPNIFANNLYLELLADLGVLGLLAFGWVLLAVMIRLGRTVRSYSVDPVVLWALCLGGGLFAFLIHGLLDYFLGIFGVCLLFWMTLGLIVAAGRLSAGGASDGPRLTA